MSGAVELEGRKRRSHRIEMQQCWFSSGPYSIDRLHQGNIQEGETELGGFPKAKEGKKTQNWSCTTARLLPDKGV